MKNTITKTGAILLTTGLSLNVAMAQVSASDFENVADSPNNTPTSEEAATVTTSTTSAVTTEEATEETHNAASSFLADVEGLTSIPSPAGVMLSWTAVPGANHYTIYYGPESAATNTTGEYAKEEYVTDGTTRHTITDLTPGTTYYFAVTAENTDTQKASQYYSAEATATPLAADATATEVTAEESKSSAPTELPQSGPLTAALAAVSAAGAYILRRRQS